MQQPKIIDIIYQIENDIYYSNYKGYDPYDGLNSNLLKFIPLPGKYSKIAWTQFFRRFPVNLRPIFFITKGLNPKGLGLLLSIYSNLYRLEKTDKWINKALNVYDLLDTVKSKNFSGKSWGYNFDWQNRSFYLKKYTPTIINTSFIGNGLIDMYDVTGNQTWLDEAAYCVEFILNDINRSYKDKTFSFSYTPIDNTIVHNANLIGASLIARFSKRINDSSFHEINS